MIKKYAYIRLESKHELLGATVRDAAKYEFIFAVYDDVAESKRISSITILSSISSFLDLKGRDVRDVLYALTVKQLRAQFKLAEKGSRIEIPCFTADKALSLPEETVEQNKLFQVNWE